MDKTCRASRHSDTGPPRSPRHVRRLVASPLGRLELETDGRAIVAVRLPGQADRDIPSVASAWGGRSGYAAARILSDAAAQLTAYFAGELREFALPLRLDGTPFQTRVWQALLEIPYGVTLSYSGLAARVGRPGAAQATGRAVGQNPVAILVPCHRVVGGDGGLTGYAGGLAAKRLLLSLEAGAPA